MKKCKKQFAVLLSVLLMLAMMPATAFAAGEDGEVAFIGETGYPTLAAAVAAAADGATITVTGDCSDESSIAINDKSLTIIGEGADKPVVKATFDIAHSQAEEPCTVTFENLRFEPTATDHVIAESSTNATSAADVNQLIVTDCEFYLTVNHGAKAAVAIIGTAGEGSGTGVVTGARLTFTQNTVKTDSYSNTEGGAGYLATAVSTSATAGTVYGPSVYSYAKHVITDNELLGHLYIGYVGGYADFTGNTVDLKYYEDGELKTDVGKGMQIRGAQADNNGGQLDLTVEGNTFKNIKEVFKMYGLDSLADTDVWTLNIAGSDGEGHNTFAASDAGEVIPNLGSADGSSMAFGTMYIAGDLNSKKWDGIAGGLPSIVFELASVELTPSGALETGSMTIDDGSQVTTYTQVNAASGERTGYYVTADDGNKYWYFAAIPPGTLHYFLDDNNNVYITKLVGGASTSSLTVSADPQPESANDMIAGTLYKADFSIITDSLSNTYYNAVIDESGEDTIKVTAKDGGAATDLNAFIADIGDYSALYITSDEAAAVPDGALRLLVPDTAAFGQILVSGAFPVTVDADIVNLDIVNKCDVSVLAGSEVKKLEIYGEEAIDSVLDNAGAIGELYMLARTQLENSGTIDKAAVGEPRLGGVILRKEKCEHAFGSVINNLGTIGDFQLASRAEVNNGSAAEKDAQINRLQVGVVGMEDENGTPYAADSRIINDAKMCAVDGKGNDIYLFARCYFENRGVIGREGRVVQTPWDDDPACDAVGGMIIVGYYGYSDAHDGLQFVNSGTIYTGARHNGATHQHYTFFMYGGETKMVNVEIYNADDGVMYGPAVVIEKGENLTHTLTALGEDRDDDTLTYALISTDEIKSADYTAVDEAIEKVPDDLSVFTAASVKALNDALDAVVRGLDLRSQLDVDAMAEAIETAIAGLQKIEPEEPGTDGPGTDEPGTDEPGTDEPGSDEPGTDEPGSGQDEPGSAEEPEKTGDESNLALWMLLMTMTGLATAGCAALKRKEN